MRTPELYKYNPDLCSPEERAATFVAREAILNSILDDLRAGAKAPVNQHYLITGPRGAGKTNMLLMVRDRVNAEEALSAAYLPLRTAEEEYSVASLRDLFAKVLDLLIEVAPDDALAASRQTVDETLDDDEGAEIAIAALKGFCERADRKLLLLVDNLDLILGDQLRDDAEIGRLRDLLMNDSFLVLIAAAPTHFEEVSGHDRPFYNFFKPVHLQEIPVEQMAELLRRRAEWDGNSDLLERFDELEVRLKQIHHLTGGNPRLALMLYQLCTHRELPEVRAALQMLLDDVTPYYKARLEQLAPQQRKVMDTFARLGHPATPTELADAARLPVPHVNSILRRLREVGFVVVSEQQRRKTTLYRVSERLFRIWHQMRFSSGGRQIQFLIEFIRLWYAPLEWAEESDRMLREYRSVVSEGRLAEAGRYVEHLEYLSAAAPTNESGDHVADATVRACIESGDFDRASAILDERVRRYTREQNADRLAQTWYLAGHLQNVQGNVDKAVSALCEAVEARPDFPEALNAWGTLLGSLARTKTGREQERLFAQAFEKYTAAVKVKPDHHTALCNWGYDLVDLARTKTGGEKERLFVLAAAKYAAAVKVKPDDHEALYGWGTLLVFLAQTKADGQREVLFAQAFEKFAAAVRVKPDMHEALYNWGTSLADLALTKKGEERERLFVQAFEKFAAAVLVKPDKYEALCNWGNALSDLAWTKKGAEQERLYAQAFEKYAAAVQVKPDEPEALNNWGTALADRAQTKKGREQERLLKEAIGKVVYAVEVAGEENAPSVALYSAHFVHLELARCTDAAEQDNVGAARELFSSALQRLRDARTDLAQRELVTFFRRITTAERAGLCGELFAMMRELGLQRELGILEPFQLAVQYWKTGNDAEVLDRLNPEVRELVEEIIAGKGPDGAPRDGD